MGFLDGSALTLLLVIGVHCFLVPYTKVEESFNVQAIHDILVLKTDIDKFDHMDFPGVVPRSFLGAAIIAAVSSPFHLLQHTFFPKAAMLTVVRLMLGSICWLAMCRVQQALRKQYGSTCAKAFMIGTAMQFHLPFYMSRTLPNTFALAVLGLAIADWIEAKHPRRLVSLLAFATV
ncbi:TPA: dolichyl-P-Man:Man(7)GlcNAc(2)-PP-dolichol alpha-1,6-mannosyltransferase [Trebouxia sp. C0006]